MTYEKATRNTFAGFLLRTFLWPTLSIVVLMQGLQAQAMGQTSVEHAAVAGATEQQVQRLSAAVAQAQTQIDAYQKELEDLQQQLKTLQKQLLAERAGEVPSLPTGPASTDLQDSATAQALQHSVDELREWQAVQESQIATIDQTKIETESKYPLKVSGLLLFNGFVNTRNVDIAADPTYATPGGGSTGASLRQTVLGLDARGPHLFGAASHADVRVDFFGGGSQSAYNVGFLRLRTAHASLNWSNTEVFVELERPLFSPNEPTSLVATAQPEFAWSGNLWTWNTQAGITQQIAITESTRVKLQAALIDVLDPPNLNPAAGASTLSSTERSRWPGAESRIALAIHGTELGVGGYFSPRETSDNARFDAWAGTLDLRIPLTRHFELTASAYRGLALGGLGGGGYVDYLYESLEDADITRALDDVGGWAQVKSKWGQKLEFNGGYGIDNPFASEIRSLTPPGSPYYGLARNRSVFANVIYSPSAYLLLSLEYRRLGTNYITGPTNLSDVIGIGAGYRF